MRPTPTGPDEGTPDSSPDAETIAWVTEAARAAAAKSDEAVTVLRVGAVLGITGHFVICSGRNPRQVKAITEEIERRVVEVGGPKPRQVEGLDTMQWVLMDYGDFVCHVFLDETRRYYDLERLWADVPLVDWRAAGCEAHPQPSTASD